MSQFAAGKRREVHGGVDGDEHVGVLLQWLVGRQRAEQGDPRDTGDHLAARTKASTAVSRWRRGSGTGGSGPSWRVFEFCFTGHL